MSNNNWKRIGGFSRTGTQNYVRTNDAAMGGTTFGSTDVSNNTGNLTQRIGNNAGVVFINGDIDMSGGSGVAAPINRIKNVRDPSNNQDVATKYYVDRIVNSILNLNQSIGPTGAEGPPGIGAQGNNGSDGSTGPTGVTGAAGPPGDVRGVIGPTGANGARGATGANGVAGATGPIGIVGPQGAKGDQGAQGIQGANGTILWLNPDGDSKTNELIIDSYLLSQFPIQSTLRTIGPISVSATYGNENKMIPASRFWNKATEISTLAVIPSGVWTVNLYAAVPSNSDANQVSIYAAIFMITGTESQPSPDSLIIETKEGGDSGYYPPRAAYLPDHVKYVGRSWEISSTPANAANVLTNNTTGVIVTSTTKNLYKIQMPVDFVTLKDAAGNSANVYLQLQIYVKNTKAANQNANVLLYYQTNPTTTETTYSYLQTTFGAVGSPGPVGTVGSVGPTGSTGNNGLAGPMGHTGIAGPMGIAGARGPTGSPGPAGPIGLAGQSNSFGVQNAVQYRSNLAPLGEIDANGSFGGSANFRFVPGPVGFTDNASDATMGTVVINDLACNSIHSSFYVENPSITGTDTRPRTFVRGGGYKLGDNSNYIVLASGKNTIDGGTRNSPATPADITHGIKLTHNIDGSPATATINIHEGSKIGQVAMKFDLTNGNITAADDKFCLLNSSGRVGVGGITPSEMTAAGASGLNRALHVSGNVMVGTQPVGTPSLVASSAMIMLNQATSAPTTKDYPGLYHRGVLSTTATTLGLQDSSGGLGITAPNFITFQTGIGATQSNSIVINSAGDVSVVGRTNLNGRVGVGINFNDTSSYNGVQSILDISGTTHMSSALTTYGDNPRIKLLSNAINPLADIPTFTQSANEIRGMNTTLTSGFLRLTAQTPANSCIDLIGVNGHSNGIKYNNSVRIATGGAERMIIDGNGNVGVGTNALVAGVRLDVAGGQARVTAASTTSTALTTTGRVGINQAAPTVDLDITGAAKITGNLDMNSTGKIVNLVNPTNAQDAATRSYVDNSIPVGGIIMWSGVTLPSNWKLCDGTTYGSVTTPDLREKFVMSSGNSNTIGSEISFNSLSSSEYTTTTNPTKNFITLNDSNLYLMGSKFGGDNESSPTKGFGSKITLTRDGTTAVIASGVRSGQHRVYKFNGYSWSWEGSIFTTEYPDIAIKNVSISDDGTTIAILIANSRVNIYNKNFNNSNSWWGDLIQTYTNPYSVSEIYYVDLVKNGATITVAFSCCTDYTSSNTGGGLVIKRYNGSSWSDIGTFNATNEDRFNTYAGALKLSSDGNIVSYVTNSVLQNIHHLYTRIYSGSGTTWNIDLNQQYIDSQYQPSICMSSDGYTVGICKLIQSGSLNNTAITIYKKNISLGTWSNFGEIKSDLIGHYLAAGNLTGLSMSGDGLTIAASSTQSNDTSGRLTVYKYSGVGTIWNKIAELFGEKWLDRMGTSNSISSDGKIIAVGSQGVNLVGNAAIYRIGPTRTLDVNINKYYSLAYIMRIS